MSSNDHVRNITPRERDWIDLAGLMTSPLGPALERVLTKKAQVLDKMALEASDLIAISRAQGGRIALLGLLEELKKMPGRAKGLADRL